MQGHQKNCSTHAPSCALSRASLWGPLCPKSWKALTSPSEWATCLDPKAQLIFLVIAHFIDGNQFDSLSACSKKRTFLPIAIHSLNHLGRLHPCGLFIIFSRHRYSSPIFQVISYIPWELSVKDVDMIVPFQSRIVTLTVAFYPHWKLAK